MIAHSNTQEARIALSAGLILCVVSVLFAVFPEVLAYPLVLIGSWAGVSLLYRGYRLRREQKP